MSKIPPRPKCGHMEFPGIKWDLYYLDDDKFEKQYRGASKKEVEDYCLRAFGEEVDSNNPLPIEHVTVPNTIPNNQVASPPVEDETLGKGASFLKAWMWQIIISGLLLVAIIDSLVGFDLEYSYFVMLRFAVCAVFAFWAFSAHAKGKVRWRNAFVLIALLYNPFLPVKLGDRDLWVLVNLITLGFVVANGLVFTACEDRGKI